MLFPSPIPSLNSLFQDFQVFRVSHDAVKFGCFFPSNGWLTYLFRNAVFWAAPLLDPDRLSDMKVSRLRRVSLLKLEQQDRLD